MSDMNERKNPYEIAVVGYSQSGKTTLAVGLFATSANDFNVTAKGAEATNYLTDRKAQLESGEWGEASIASTDIRLEINRKEKLPVTIDFRDYRGEDARNSEAFKRDVIGDPRGVLILLNPSMDILRDPERRNEMIAQIKGIIAYLSEPDKRCSHIAFVITASDLLTTSLKDYKDEFDNYKEEITNCLNVNQKFQKAWKEFDVTVTGPLEDPSRPRIARKDGNTSREPFVWLIDQIETADRDARRQKMVRHLSFMVSTLIVLGLSALAGWYFGLDRTAERKLHKVLMENGPSLDRTVKKDEIKKFCKTMEDALKPEEGSRSFFAKPYFTANQVRYDKAQKDIKKKIEAGYSRYYPLQDKSLKEELTKVNPQDGISCQNFSEKIGDVREFEEGFYAFSENRDDMKSLRTDWAAFKTGIVEKLESACCTGFKKELTSECEEIKKILECDEEITGDPFKCWSNMLSNAENASKLMGDSKSLNAIIKEAYEKKTNLVGRCEAKKFKDELKTLLDKVKSEGAERPCLPTKVEERVRKAAKNKDLPKEAFVEATNEFYTAFREEKIRPWEESQNAACDEFINKIDNRRGFDNARATLTDYQNHCSDHPNAPKLKEVAQKVNDVVLPAFKEIYNETEKYLTNNAAIWDSRKMRDREKNMEKTFNNLKSLVNATVKAGDNKNCKSFRASDAYRFASACQKQGLDNRKTAFKQDYMITRIDATANDTAIFGSYTEIKLQAGKTVFSEMNNFEFTPLKTLKSLKYADNKKKRTIFNGGAIIVDGTPWADAIFEVKADDDGEVGEFRVWLSKGAKYELGQKKCVQGRAWVDSDTEVSVYIDVQGSGPDFLSFAMLYLFGDN